MVGCVRGVTITKLYVTYQTADVPALAVQVGAGMEVFMIKTGFYDKCGTFYDHSVVDALLPCCSCYHACS